MPLFSVIIPTFNRAALLGEALASVFAQRFTDYEVIVADDGSTDETASLLAALGDRVHVVRQSNGGPGAARNLAAKMAQGRYLAFLDSDDMWFPWTLEVYESIVRDGVPVFVAGKKIVFTATSDLASTREQAATTSSFADYYASGDEWRWYSASSFVIRTDAFRAVEGFAPIWINGEDADLAMRLGNTGPFVQVTSPQTFGYRDHGSSLVSQSRRTLDGVQYALRMELEGRYPGGPRRARERRTILTRHFRPVMLTCLREGRVDEAWQLYWSTWPWHLALGRVRFLCGFPIQALLETLWRRDRHPEF